MSDLKLLSPDKPTPLERLLIDAVVKESPSAAQRLRVREALGLPAVVAAPPLPRVSRAALWIKGAVVGAIVVSALVLQLRPQARGPLRAQAPLAGSAAQAEPPAARGAAKAIADTVPALETAPAPLSQASAAPTSSVLAPARAHAAASSRAPSSAAGDDPSEQLRLIELARRAVAAHDASGGAQALSSYSSRFPHGMFSQEAFVLRIQILDLQGQHARAAALAKAFLAQHPNSPHVSVVQRIAGTPSFPSVP